MCLCNTYTIKNELNIFDGPLENHVGSLNMMFLNMFYKYVNGHLVFTKCIC